MLKKSLSIILSVSLTAGLLAGCIDNNKAKEAMQQALTKQSEVNHYRFTGNAQLPSLPILPNTNNPLVSGMAQMFKDGKIEWQGLASKDPIRLEASVKLTPGNATAAIELPMILKDNKMYIHIPVLNKAEEYLMIDMNQPPAGTTESPKLLPENLKNAGEVSRTIVSTLLTDANAKWFDQDKQKRKLKDGAEATVYALNITDKNVSEISKLWSAKLPAIADTLKQYGLISDKQAEQWKTSTTPLQIQAPGRIQIAVDAQGFIREEEITLQVVPGTQADAKPINIQIQYALDEINQTPKFEKETPASVKPMDQIMKLLLK